MKMLIAIILMLFPIADAVANIVDIECKVTPYGDTYTNFLEHTKNDSSETARQVKSMAKDDILLRIDFDKEKVVYPWMYKNKIDISPKHIIIIEFMTCENNSYVSCKDEVLNFTINRATGAIEGQKTAGDDSWSPYFKKGDLMWFYTGTCELIHNKI